MPDAELLQALGFGAEMALSIGLYVCFQERRPHFIMRMIACLAVLCVVCLPYRVFLAGWLALFIVGIYLWTLASIKLCFQLTWQEALVCWIAGCATQFISSQAFFLVSGVFSLGRLAFPIQVCIMLAVYCICFLVFGRQLRKEQIEIYSDSRVLAMALTVWIIVDISCNYGRRADCNWQTPLSNLFGIFCALFILVIEFNLLEESRTLAEKRMIEGLLAKEAAQHRIAKEAVDYINIKSHDLKYQLESFRTCAAGGSAKKLQLDEMEKQIGAYDSLAATGNTTLDIILTEKGIFCNKHHIKLLPMIDGSAIDFMPPQDIYPLFSNIIDNAIECLCKVPDEEKRVIDLSVTRQGSMISISCANYCEEPPVFSEGIPMTTKEDTTQHGFGVKSIRYLVQKYGGNVAFDWSDQRFSVFILITAPNS